MSTQKRMNQKQNEHSDAKNNTFCNNTENTNYNFLLNKKFNMAK